VFFRLAICVVIELSCGRALFSQGLYMTGVQIVQPAPACPAFVTEVYEHSPAQKAGVLPGDRLLAIDGSLVSSISDAAKRLSATSPGPVTLELLRNGTREALTVLRESQAALMSKRHYHLIDGEWQPRELSKADIEYRKHIEGLLNNHENMVGIAFTAGHYPRDLTLYYPGFEVFVVRDVGPLVGGIENGPAHNSGIRSCDIILAIDGRPTAGLSPEEMERLLSSTGPKQITILIKRLSKTKRYRFSLERADQVLTESGLQVINGVKFPAAIPPADLNCAFGYEPE
jgi:C-terminal processing protease CtpA/Prc